MILAILAAEPVKVLAGGYVESVVTFPTHFRFRGWRVVEVEGNVVSDQLPLLFR